MTIEAIANHNELEKVQISITTTMPLAQWKIIQNALKSGITSSYNNVTALYLHSLSDIIDNYHEKIVNKIENEN
jgi:hypothetical protein